MRVITLVLLFAFLFTGVLALAQNSDDQIYDQVRLRLARDPDVKGGGFEVEVKAGVVTIKGVVEKEKWKEKAERLARKVKGVKSVVNQIVVKPRSA
jgi:hyperosmotically inducible protein